MSKVERLLNLTAVLLSTKRPLSAKELREKVEGYAGGDSDSFNRMFERDKDDLRNMGVPIEVKTSFTDSATAEGYIISEGDYYLDLNLSESELEAINLAVLTAKIDTDDAAEGIWKLGGAATSGDQPEVVGSISFDEVLPQIFAAAKDSQVIEFEYNDKRRVVSPWRLDFRRAKWYLIGFDHGREAERNYRLDRLIGSVKSVESPDWVAPPVGSATDRQKHPWEYGDESQEVVLWVSSDRADAVSRILGESGRSEVQADGSTHFRFNVSAVEPFYGFVIEYLDNAEILEPKTLRDGFIRLITSVRESCGQTTSA